MPTVQSNGCSQTSNSVSSVTETDREGSSDSEMGEKRVSESADVRAYEGIAVVSGREVNVPMQPRRCFSSSASRVFQVTNKGDSSISFCVTSSGVDVPSPDGVVCAVVFDNDEELESGVEECNDASWEMRVFLVERGELDDSCDLLYSVYDCWTWERDIGGRFSRVAERDSKQTRQWIVVAMMKVDVE